MSCQVIDKARIVPRIKIALENRDLAGREWSFLSRLTPKYLFYLWKKFSPNWGTMPLGWAVSIGRPFPLLESAEKRHDLDVLRRSAVPKCANRYGSVRP
jgi:hypothetical protein